MPGFARVVRGLGIASVGLAAAAPAGALAARPGPLPRAPSAAQHRALEAAVHHTRGLHSAVVVYVGISPVDARWAVADVIPPPGTASAAGRRTAAHVTYHRGARGWESATAPLGPISRSLFRRPTFRIDYVAHGTEHQAAVVPGADCDITDTNDAVFAWHGVWRHVTEDELVFGTRLGYDEGSTVDGSQTHTHLQPCDNDAANPPRQECTGREKLVPARVSPLIDNILWATVSDDEAFTETIHLGAPQFDLTPPASCPTDLWNLRWPQTTITQVTLPADRLFFTTSRRWSVAIDDPALENHDRVTDGPGGTETVDWSGTVTLRRDGSYRIPLPR